MALKDVLVKPVKPKNPTWYEIVASQLDKDDLAWLDSCLDNTIEFSGAYIAQAMTKAGYPVSSTTINHLRKQRNG